MRSALKDLLLWLSSRFDRRGAGIPVLLYHSLDDGGSALSVPPGQFRAQMEHLARSGWQVVGMRALLERWDGTGAAPRRTAVLTLDDGLVSQHRVAFPILRDLGFAATVFVPTQQLGATAEWNRRDAFPEFPLMTWDDAAQMVAGGMEIEPHGRRHRSLPGLDDAALADEVLGSVDDIRKHLGVEPGVFSYPFGHEDARVRSAVVSAGIPSAVAVIDAVYQPGDDRLRIPRISMDSSRAHSERAARLLVENAVQGSLVDLLRAKRAILRRLGRMPSVPSQHAS